MRLALFGGSFDPIHRGHVEPVRAAVERLGLDRVLYLPTADPPHKDEPRRASALERYVMVELALLDEERLFASPHELTPGRPAYTVETLEHFRGEHPGAELFLVLGSDSFADLGAWRRGAEIPRLARLVVLARPGREVAEARSALAPEVAAALAETAEPAVVERPVDVSSTEIRRRLAAGRPIPEGWLHPRVLDYAERYGIYR